jgi:FkbM family methyltransferase
MRVSAATFRDPFRALLLLRGTYKNWLEIMTDYFARRPLERAVLRNGFSIPLARKPSSLLASLRHYHRWYDPSIYNLIGLARLLGKGWEIKGIDGEHVLLSPEPSTLLKCRINQGTDISLLGEIFIRKVYGTDFQGKTVVDVGAYTCDSAVYFARHGARLVIALEPDPRNFQLASENIRLNRLENTIKLVKVALAVQTGESKLGLNVDTPNITQFTDGADTTENSLAVDTLTVDDLMKQFSLSNIDVLKLNCEGCEYGIIRNLPDETLRHIGAILLEFHSGPRDLPGILSRHGFKSSIRGGTFGYLAATRTVS